jgi:signal transduction histidine kinase
MAGRLLVPFTSPRTGREAGFLLSALPLGIVWLTVLVSAWAVTLSVAITPLVVPALLGVGLLVRGCGAVESALCRNLLDARVGEPRRPAVSGVLRRAWQAIANPWVWTAQAYLALRITVGLASAIALIALAAAGALLVAAPAVFWAFPHGIDVGLYRARTFPESLPLLPVGLGVLLAVAWAIRPLTAPWRALAPVLLGGEDPRVGQREQQRRRPAQPDRSWPDRSVSVHALAVGGLCLLLIVIWAITSRGYFWPVWAMLAFGAALAIHAWVGFAEAHRSFWREHRMTSGFAIHAGVWVVVLLFLTGVWAASGGGYYWPVWPLLVALLATGAHLAAVLGSARDRAAMTERISSLESSRAGAVDVQEAELRRIERDLHDGAQARLVALGMSLGMAEQKLDTDADAARELLADARAGAGEALRELRALTRGIHPPVLADRGLDAAVRALAAASPIAVTVSVVIPERPRAPVESAAYFVVAEALANAGKHANASRIDVRMATVGQVLAVEVHDDGVGGADATGGGLDGLRRRVEALDGTLSVLSPKGGPTTIRAELPCGS